jgi:hypothetical protein
MICNVKAVYFVPLLARPAIQFGLFEEQERGGLLCQDNMYKNVLQDLVNSDTVLNNCEHHEHVSSKYLQVLIQLRKMVPFKKEDSQINTLLPIEEIVNLISL